MVVAIGADEADLAISDGEAVVVLPGLAVDPVGHRWGSSATVVRAGLLDGADVLGSTVVRRGPLVVGDLVGNVDDVAVAPSPIRRRRMSVVVGRRVASVGISRRRRLAVGGSGSGMAAAIVVVVVAAVAVVVVAMRELHDGWIWGNGGDLDSGGLEERWPAPPIYDWVPHPRSPVPSPAPRGNRYSYSGLNHKKFREEINQSLNPSMSYHSARMEIDENETHNSQVLDLQINRTSLLCMRTDTDVE